MAAGIDTSPHDPDEVNQRQHRCNVGCKLNKMSKSWCLWLNRMALRLYGLFAAVFHWSCFGMGRGAVRGLQA